MKVVLLAGGLGTRISEESHLKPKPMICLLYTSRQKPDCSDLLPVDIICHTDC